MTILPAQHAALFARTLASAAPLDQSRSYLNQPLFGRQILVVEDEMLILMDAEDMLFELGCKSVSAAGTIGQAIGLISMHSFDAALLDLNLNGERSFAVADALAATDIPFAFATGYGSRGLRKADSGRPLLTKPYGIGELGYQMSILVSR